MAGSIMTEAGPSRPRRRSRFIQFISRCARLRRNTLAAGEHDNIVDHQLGDREWRAVHKMVVVRSHWPCRLRDRGRSHLVARIWRPTSPDVVPPLDRQFHGMRESAGSSGASPYSVVIILSALPALPAKPAHSFGLTAHRLRARPPVLVVVSRSQPLLTRVSSRCWVWSASRIWPRASRRIPRATARFWRSP